MRMQHGDHSGWMCMKYGMALILSLSGCGLLGIDWIPEDPTTTVQFYTVPFLCELNDAGELAKSSDVILHNPEANEMTVYRRGVLIVDETAPEPDGVVWNELELAEDQAVRLDCDAFVRILTDDPSATFGGEFPPGTHLDGFLTIGVEAGTEFPRLDASVQYSQLDGSFTITPIEPVLVTVDAWPPIVP